MALKAQINADEFGKLPEPVQAEYRQDGDNYVLDVTEVNGLALANVSKLETTLDKVRREAREAKKLAEQYDGLDAKAARDALDFKTKWDAGELPNDAKARLAEKEKQLKDQYEGRVGQLSESYKKQLEEAKTREQRLLNEVTSKTKRTEIQAAINKYDGNALLLEPVLSQRVVIVEEDGEFRRQVLGDNGKPMLSRLSGKTDQYMDVDEFVAIMRTKPEYAPAFKGSGSTGGGNQPSRGSQSTGSTVRLTESQAKDVALYRAARERATKEGKSLEIVPD
jgi:hypothetical protein